MFGPMRSPDGQGGGGPDRVGPRERSVLELRPLSIVVDSINSAQLENLFRAFTFPVPADFASEIYDLLAAGKRPDVENIVSQFEPDSAGSFESYTRWEVTSTGVRSAVECTITLDEERCDLRLLSFCLRSELGSGIVSLRAEFDELSLFSQGIVPDRWMVFEQVLAALDLPYPRPYLTVAEDAHSIALGEGAHVNFAGVEPIGIPALHDPHLALRRDLAVDVLCAEKRPLSTAADALCKRIFKGREGPWALLQAPNGIEEVWRAAQDSCKARTLTLLYHDGLLLPISRTATMQSVTEDLRQLQKLRSDIRAREPDESLVAPAGMLLSRLSTQETATVMGILSISLPSQFLEHLHDVLVKEVPFEPGFITPSNLHSRSLSVAFGEISVESEPSGLEAAPTFRLSKPGAPKVMIWAGGLDEEDLAEDPHIEQHEEGLCLYVSWPMEPGRVAPPESIYRWGLVKLVHAALGRPPLPSDIDKFFASADEDTSEEGRLEVFTVKMAPEI